MMAWARRGFWVLLVASAAGSLWADDASVIQRVAPPASVRMGSETLVQNGTAVGRATFLGIKVYVAALYVQRPTTDARAVLSSTGPLRFDFTFLRRVDPPTNVRAWSAYFDHIAEAAYPAWAADRTLFLNSLGTLQRGTVQTVELVGDETLFYEGGTLRCRIPGVGFRKAFLSIWMSDRPEQAKIRRGLLGQGA